MPWNFPVWQVMRGAVPILLAGNSYLLKHAPNVMGSARLLGEIFAAAGLPDGVFGWVNATNDGVSQIINDDRIAAVTVTGSVRAGRRLAPEAGAALKKCVLELGGSDPFIVLNDADLDEAVKAAVTGRYQNSGRGVCGVETLYSRSRHCRGLHPQICRRRGSAEDGRPARRAKLRRTDGAVRFTR